MDHATDWNQTDIIAALHEQGTSLAKISQNAGLRAATLHNALVKNWPKGEQLIATALNLPPAIIWPTRYLHRASLLSEK